MPDVPDKSTFQSLYSGQPPWDIGKPQKALIDVADQITGSLLDAGCGTGDNACISQAEVTGALASTFSIRLFVTVGKGTLAPWNPTQKLVVEGIYRHVRNPMISGGMFILLGEALLAASLPLLI